MPSIALGGSVKGFYRAFTASDTFAPDASTIGSRTNALAGDTDINTACDNVVQASGEGWIIPTNKNVFVIFTGWTNAVIEVQAYMGIGTAGWVKLLTITEPMKATNLNFSCPFPIRIGVPAGGIGADAATLKMWTGYNDEGLNV